MKNEEKHQPILGPEQDEIDGIIRGCLRGGLENEREIEAVVNAFNVADLERTLLGLVFRGICQFEYRGGELQFLSVDPLGVAIEFTGPLGVSLSKAQESCLLGACVNLPPEPDARAQLSGEILQKVNDSLQRFWGFYLTIREHLEIRPSRNGPFKFHEPGANTPVTPQRLEALLATHREGVARIQRN